MDNVKAAQPTGHAVLVRLLMTIGAVLGIAWTFAYVVEPMREDRVRAKYQECVERGGTITEGFGISCVGVKTPPANP